LGAGPADYHLARAIETLVIRAPPCGLGLWNGWQIPISALSQLDGEEDRMTPEERSLIEDLFDRMRSYGSPEKDREAEYLIKERIRAMPDAAYMLTQSVLVQEQALQAANERVAELEDRVRELQESQEGPPPRRGGSFLGGGFSNRERAPEARPSSVPQVGARATPSAYERPSVWGAGAPPPPPPPQAPQAGGGGGFMRSAIATAAGVAGGVLVADSIRNMMGGGHAKAGETSLGRDEHKQQVADDSSHQHDDQQGHDDQQDQGEYDTAEDDSVDSDSDGDFGDDSIDV